MGAGLDVNREKCEFCCSQVSYLGFLFDREGLRSDPEKVTPNYPVPKNVKQLRRFLGDVKVVFEIYKARVGIKNPLGKDLEKGERVELGRRAR